MEGPNCIGFKDGQRGDGVCRNYKCQHNIFFGIYVKSTTTLTRQIRNCMRELSQPMTFQEIGDILGLSKQRVQQIEEKALNKIRGRFRHLKREEFRNVMELIAP